MTPFRRIECQNNERENERLFAKIYVVKKPKERQIMTATTMTSERRCERGAEGKVSESEKWNTNCVRE